jgi:PPOX class probable F420-dependent enzyme
VQLNPQQLSHVLGVWSVARLATIGAHDQPHLVPIVFVWVDGYIYSPVDGKPKRGDPLQRLRNVARHPSVSLLLDHYDVDWRMLWWLRLDATAEVVSGDAVATPALARIVNAMRNKYPQYQSVDVLSGAPTMLRLQLKSHTAWSAQPVVWESL